MIHVHVLHHLIHVISETNCTKSETNWWLPVSPRKTPEKVPTYDMQLVTIGEG
jgi:hypothetical protein